MEYKFDFNSTNNELAIVELQEPYDRLFLQFVPYDISNPRDVSLQSYVVVGRNNEKFFYSSGSDTLSMNLDFHSSDETAQDVDKAIRFLKSLTINDGAKNGYRNVKLIWGDLFKDDIWILTKVDPKMQYFDAKNGWLPLRAEVSVTFKLDPKNNLTIRDVRR